MFSPSSASAGRMLGNPLRFIVPMSYAHASVRASSTKALPNPSLERTSTSKAREPLKVIVASRGPCRLRPAQLKR